MTPDSLLLPGFFLSEWNSRRPGERRSLMRARRLAGALGLLGQARPLLSVVGSKGKGTAAIYASALLAAAGQRVVTVTGPGYRTATERIRVGGRALSAGGLADLAARLSAARGAAGDRTPGAGYLAPTGLFTLAGVLHARDVAADVIVLEAGMGGVSDEISLFAPTVVALTPVFAEHVGKIGDTRVQIARNKAGIVTPTTRAVLTVPQTADVAQEIMATVKERSAGRVRVEIINPGSTAIPTRMLPAGLSAHNAELGCAAARRLLDATRRAQPTGGRLAAILDSVRLPGRLSRHELPGSRTELVVDSAISPAGITAALAAAARWWPGIDHVLLCLPDHKDVPGAVRELTGLRVIFVRLPDERMRFTYPLPADWAVIDAAHLTREFVAGLGRRVMALGTVYFIGRILDLVDADMQSLFSP